MKQTFATITAISASLALHSTITAGEYTDSLETSKAHHNSGDYLGLDFSRGWFERPGAHNHSSQNSSANYIHPLTVEAAFNDNDFFLDYAFNSFDDEDEHEIEIELELALTRRIGLVLETAYEFENEDGSTNEGFADLGIAARFVLAEYKNFIATANLEFSLPTGDDDFSENQITIEPGLLFWFNLGNGFTLNTAVGIEHETESEENEFFFNAALVKHVYGPLSLSRIS